MIMAEPFRLWAIESASEHVNDILSFTKADPGVVVTPRIEKFRELKLRLLNGTHSFICGLAILSGFEAVKEAMVDDDFANFTKQLMLLEIAPVLDDKLITYDEACAFADKVLDRFRNPAIDHKWINIATNYSSKMKMRIVQLLLAYYKKFGKTPVHMAAGLAGYLAFMNCKAGAPSDYVGAVNGRIYAVQDEQAAYFSRQWKNENMDNFVDTVLANEELWGADLSRLEGLASGVKENLVQLKTQGAPAVIAGKQLKTIG
jgi:tagaturonate reductase